MKRAAFVDCRNHPMREVRILASVTYDLPEKTLGGVMGELKFKRGKDLIYKAFPLFVW